MSQLKVKPFKKTAKKIKDRDNPIYLTIIKMKAELRNQAHLSREREL